MKMDKDVVRAILIEVAKRGHSPLDFIEDFAVGETSEDVVSYHVWLLQDGGFLLAENLPTLEGSDVWVPKVLTYEGQQFLTAVEDAEVWRRTKELAKKGGAEGLKAVWGIAGRVAEKKLDEFLKGEGL